MLHITCAYNKRALKLIVGHNTQCEQLCTVTVSEHDADEAKRLVEEEYRVEWYDHYHHVGIS